MCVLARAGGTGQEEKKQKPISFSSLFFTGVRLYFFKRSLSIIGRLVFCYS